MSSGIYTEEESLLVSNRRFDSLIFFALEVGAEIATTPDEGAFVAQLCAKYEYDMYPGYDILIDTDFPALEMRLFWSKVFEDLSRRVLSREIANPDAPDEVRLSLASDAEKFSQMLLS